MLRQGLEQAAFIKDSGCSIPCSRQEASGKPRDFGMMAVSNEALGDYVSQSLSIAILANAIRETDAKKPALSSHPERAPAL